MAIERPTLGHVTAKVAAALDQLKPFSGQVKIDRFYRNLPLGFRRSVSRLGTNFSYRKLLPTGATRRSAAEQQNLQAGSNGAFQKQSD